MTAARVFEQKIMNGIPFGIILYIDFTSPGFFQSMYQTWLGRILYDNLPGCVYGSSLSCQKDTGYSYIESGQGKMKEKIKKWKKQLLCMGISVVLGAVAWIVQDMDPVIKEGNVLERPEAEDSYKDQKLYVKGLLEKGGEVPLELRIYPKQNTKEEAYSLYEEILEQIPEQIRGENLSLEDVRTDLDLIAQWPEYGIALSWQSAEPEILENDGILHHRKTGRRF